MSEFDDIPPEDEDDFGLLVGENGQFLTRRPYHMSALALAKRREASKHSTGPRTEEGKAISSRNAYKHGQSSLAPQHILNDWRVGAFAKPCLTTCDYHPDNKSCRSPCHLVEEGLTGVGGDCLDKTVFVSAFDAILKSIDGDVEGLNSIMSAEMAGAIELLRNLREEISNKGLVHGVPMINKEGEPVLNPTTGEMVIGKYIGNAAIPQYVKLLGELGLSLPEMMVTPKARQSVVDESDKENALALLLGGAFNRVVSPRIVNDESK